MGQFCYCKWKFKVQMIECNVYSDEKRTNFSFQSERDSPCKYVLLSIYILFTCTHTFMEGL